MSASRPSDPGRVVVLAIAIAAFGLIAFLLTRGFLETDGHGSGLARGGVEDGLRPAGAQALTPAAEPDRGAGADSGREEVPLEATAELAALPEVEPIEWSGRVVSRLSREPLVGASVSLIGDPGGTETRTDEAGAFQLAWSRAGVPAVEVSCEGFVTQRRPRVDFTERGDFELDPGGEIVVLVSGPVGSELAEAKVSLWDLTLDSRTRSAPTESEADASGVFRFGELGAGEYAVAASVPGWSLVYEHRVLVESGQRVDLVLEPARGATLRGVVRWEQELTPAVGVDVLFMPEQQGASGNVEGRAAREAETDASGRFELTGLSVGRGDLILGTDRGEHHEQEVFISEPGQDIEHEFELSRPGSIAGRVINSRGQGVAGALLSVSWRRASVQELRESEHDPDRLLRVTCDANGRFLVEDIPARRSLYLAGERPEGSSSELFGSARLQSLRSGEERQDLELVVAETLAVPGRVVDIYGEGIEGARLRVSSRGQRSSSRWGETRSDEEGDFELTGLLPGRYRLDVRPPRSRGDEPTYLDARQDFVLALGVELEPLEVELEESHEVVGWVVDEWGAAVPGALVRARYLPEPGGEAPRDERQRADDFGRFEIDDLLEGTYALTASASGYETSEEPLQLEVPGGIDATLVLKRKPLVERAVLYGRAIDSAGDPPIALRLGDTRGGSLSQTGEDFRITGVRAGRTRLEFRAEGQIPLRLDTLDIAPGAELDLGELRFEQAGELQVFVKAKGGEPLRGFNARLLALPVEQGGRGAGSVRLRRERTSRRWEPNGPRVSSERARSSRVPLAKWRLSVELAGYQRHRRTIALTPERSKRTIVVELEPK